MDIEVECATGGEGPAPVRLKLARRTVDVAAVLDRWPGADHWYVKVRGRDDAIYILRLDLASGRWQIVFYDSRAGA